MIVYKGVPPINRRDYSFEQTFAKMADRAMAKRQTSPAEDGPKRVNWIAYRAQYGAEWRSYKEIAALVHCKYDCVAHHVWENPGIYEKKMRQVMLVRVR